MSKKLRNLGRLNWFEKALAVLGFAALLSVIVLGIQAAPSPAVATPSPTTIPSTAPTAVPSLAVTPDGSRNVGSFVQWSKVEIVLPGPPAQALSPTSNPFRLVVDVTFSDPNGQSVVVPAFYDGDGQGGLDGNVWKVRFSPDTPGNWTFRSQSDVAELDGQQGSFAVTAPTGCQPYQPGGLPNFACMGRLRSVGEFYLAFADGTFWVKGGADEPEDFLAPGRNAGFATKEEAIDYLAARSINSIYLMPLNIDGDGDNVWPFIGSTPAEARANSDRYDVAKLAEWEALFSYIQQQGIVLHLVLEDDSAWNNFDQALYYRELVARFAHHPGLYWNIAEEYNENYNPDEVRALADQLRAIDPYDHPITIHNEGSLENWAPFIGDPRFDLTSLQTTTEPQNATVIEWRSRVRAAGRVIPIMLDETGQFTTGQRDRARHVVWSIYLGGGNYEIFTTLGPDGYRDYDAFFGDITRARTLLEQTPYWSMEPANDLLEIGEGYVLAQPGQFYLGYLPDGGTASVDVMAATGELVLTWMNPRTGAMTAATTVNGGAVLQLTPPFEGDAAFLIRSPSASPPEAQARVYFPLIALQEPDVQAFVH